MENKHKIVTELLSMQDILNDTRNDEAYFLVDYYESRIIHWFESWANASDIGRSIEMMDIDSNLCIVHKGEILSLDGEHCLFNNRELYIDSLSNYTI